MVHPCFSARDREKIPKCAYPIFKGPEWQTSCHPHRVDENLVARLRLIQGRFGNTVADGAIMGPAMTPVLWEMEERF